MATTIYGDSHFINFEGDIESKFGCYGIKAEGILIMCSDGTLLKAKYGENDMRVMHWEIKALRKGELFDKINIYLDPDAKIYSDIANFKDGLKWVYVCIGYWECVRWTFFRSPS